MTTTMMTMTMTMKMKMTLNDDDDNDNDDDDNNDDEDDDANQNEAVFLTVVVNLRMYQVSSSDTVITRQYTYSGQYGPYVVNVRAFNLANNDTRTASVNVLEWHCYQTNVTVDPLFADQNEPYVVLEEAGFTVAATFDVDCMKMQLFEAKWEILDGDSQEVLSTLANATQLVSAPNALDPGSYTIRITATMSSSYFDLSDKTVISYAYVQVERCLTPNITVSALFASATQPYRVLVESGFTITMAYVLDCAKLEQLTIRWDITDNAQDSIVSTLANATQLTSSPNALAAGTYGVDITMTMSSSYFDLSAKTVIAKAYVTVDYCHPPNVTLSPSASDSDDPFSVMDNAEFTLAARLSMDCPPMDHFTVQWDVLDSTQQTVLRTEPNATELVTLAYGLAVGTYVVRVTTTLTCSFLDLSQKTVISFVHVEILKSSLTAGITGNRYINAPFNSTVLFSFPFFSCSFCF